MANFKHALERTVAHEGGYVDDVDDAGGETYKGVSRRYNPTWAGWYHVDILREREPEEFPDCLDEDPNLRLAVVAFYREHYWDKFWGDHIPDQGVANELFDTAVNMGTTRAVEFLQGALNVLNRNGSLYPDLVDDGVFGPKTLRALESYLDHDPPETLLKVMNILQGMHYLKYMQRSPIQEKYARGWLRRVTIDKS